MIHLASHGDTLLFGTGFSVAGIIILSRFIFLANKAERRMASLDDRRPARPLYDEAGKYLIAGVITSLAGFLFLTSV